MNFFFSVFPVFLLIFMMTYKKGLPSQVALPVTALLTYFLQLWYFKQDVTQIHATVVAGFLTTFTPISILWGAIFLFKTMEVTESLDHLKMNLNRVSAYPIAQLMIVGWSFSFFVEGISGFGTPAALAAPLLVGFGFNPIPVVLFCLALNTVPVTFGAVGTPIWFGLSELKLGEEVLKQVGFKAAVIQSVVAFVIPILALRFLTSWQTIKKNILFIFLSIAFTVLPFLALSKLSVEFPSILGGVVGIFVTVLLAKFKVGMAKEKIKANEEVSSSIKPEYFRAFFPLAATVFLLLVTRIQGLGLKAWLSRGVEIFEMSLGNLGVFKMSSSFVLELQHILGTTIAWKHAVLYIPSLIPFGIVAFISFLIFKTPASKVRMVCQDTLSRLLNPFLALVGAMIFVKLMMLGGERAPVIMMGHTLAEVSGQFWGWISVFLGSLGSFFAGSATVSNLTFAPIQLAVAEKLMLNNTSILALQTVGGAMGNMACIHNIVAVCAVLGLKNQEGYVLKKIAPLLFFYGILSTLAAVLIFGV